MALRFLCPNCYTLNDNPWSLSQGFCSYQCWVKWDERAVEAGGYHVLARDEKIRELQYEMTLREKLEEINDLLRSRGQPSIRLLQK